MASIAKSKKTPQEYESGRPPAVVRPYAIVMPSRRFGLPLARQRFTLGMLVIAAASGEKIYTKWMSTISRPISFR